MLVAGVQRITPAGLEDFKDKVSRRDGHFELECAKYLAHAADILTRGTTIEILDIEREEGGYFGRADFILPAVMLSDRGVEERKVYLFELKAPQCWVMEPDDNAKRYRATSDLIKAENQLLHLYSQVREDTHFCRRYKVDVRNIIPGGIVIGCRPDRFAKKANTDAQHEAAAFSLSLREEYLYKALGIRVVTWDRILRQLDGMDVQRSP